MTGPADEAKNKIFVSYSRRDIEFVDKLETALRERGIDPLIDRAEIAAFEDWWARIQSLILSAHTVVFVISQDSIGSATCQKEVAFAASLNKRLAPIVTRRVPDDAPPEELRRLNYIFFDDPNRFDASISALVAALETDVDWVRKHADIGVKARRWAEAGKPGPKGLLLSPPDLDDAERWISLRPRGAPEPTELQAEFILQSRQAEQLRAHRERRRNRWIMAGSISATVIVSMLGWLFFNSSQEALRSQSLFLADAARLQIGQSDFTTAQLLALEALPDQRASTLTQRIRPLVGSLEAQLFGSTRELKSRDWSKSQILTGHEASVLRGVFSPSGRLVATSSADKTVRIWNAATGEQVKVMRGHTDGVMALGFSPDGRVLASGSQDGTARLWDVERGLELAILTGHEPLNSFGSTRPSGVRRAIFSPNGEMLATCGDDKTVRLWDVKQGKELLTLRGHTDLVWMVTWSPDGKMLASASQDGTARLWEFPSGREMHVLRGLDREPGGNTNDPKIASFSPDGTKLATASADGLGRIWDVKSGQVSTVLKGHANWVWYIEFSPDGRTVATSSDDNTARLWDVETGAQKFALNGHAKGVRRAIFSPDGKLVATTSLDGDVRIWDAETGMEHRRLVGHRDWAISIAFSPDGRQLLSASLDGTARLWQPEAEHPAMPVGKIARAKDISKNSQLLLTSGENASVHLWDLQTRVELPFTVGSKRRYITAEFAGDDKFIILSSMDKAVVVVDIGSMTERHVLEYPQNDTVPIPQLSPDEKLFAVGTGTEIHIVDVATGEKQSSFPNVAKMSVGDFSPDGRAVSIAGRDGQMRVFPVMGGEPVRVIGDKSKYARLGTFAPDGKKMIVSYTSSEGTFDYSAELLSVDDGKSLMKFPQSFVGTFSSDGRLLAINDGPDRYGKYRTRIIDVRTLQDRFVLENSNGGVFYGTSNLFVAVSIGTDLTRVYDVDLAAEVVELKGSIGPFTSDGKRFVFTSADGNVYLYPAPAGAQALIEEARASLPRCLSQEERKSFRLSPAPPRWCFDNKLWPYQQQEPPRRSWDEWLVLLADAASGNWQ